MLFSADPLLASLDGHVLQADVEEQTVLSTDLSPATDTPSADVGADIRRELVFVDSTVPDYQQLVDDLLATGDDGRQFEVVVLDSDRDGVEQMAETLAGGNSIDAIHIVSHGNQAELFLGTAQLTLDSMTGEYADELAAIGQSLTDSADLLIYGCNFGQGDLGQEAAARLAQITGADVATSIDDTGSARYGGDWNLERATGAIETEVAFSQSLQQNWEHLLNVTIDSTSVGTTPQFTGSDTVSHTTSGTERLMLVGISFGVDQLDTVSAVTYNGTALTLVGVQESTDNAKSRVEIWSLVAPDTGTHNVDVTYSGTNHEGATIGVMTFNGVDQTTPLGTFAGAASESSNPSATVSSATGELVFGVVAFSDSNDWDLVQGAGQTEHWDLFVDQTNGAGTTEAGAASVVTSWTVGDTKKWAAGGVSIKPSTALVVDTTNDVTDGDTSSITALLADKGADGFISLREAIIAVNAGAGGDTIVLPPGTYTLSITGSGEDAAATGDLDILKDVTITGEDAATTVIDAAGIDGVLDVQAGITTISGVSITGGSKLLGAGIDTQSAATLNLTDVEIRDNNSTDDGGAIYMLGASNLDRVTFANNTASNDGGAIYFRGAGPAVLTNVTFSGNSATRGGAVYNFQTDVTLINNTIVLNSSGIDGQGGGAVTKIQNSILDNIGANSVVTLTSLGSNIDSDGTANGLVDGVNNDQVGTAGTPIDPLLGPLQDNGGMTKTHALLAGSPAINAGTAAGAPATDQRGILRDAAPDIGAFESTSSNTPPTLDLDADDSGGAGGADFVATFTEGGGAVGIADADASLSDVDSANLISLTVTITNLLDGASEALAADVSGTGITASYNSVTGVLTLSGADTVVNYQQVLRTVTYDNSSATPNMTARFVTFVANDGTDPSNVGTTTVTVNAVNDAPVITSDGGAATAAVSVA
ncbi:MAG: DUF4347 domain-containing protein, partial [Acidiferrobacterales bacterium]